MNKYEVIDALLSSPHDDVLIEINGMAYEISGFGEVEEYFDGFDTAYPAAITIKPNNDE